MRKASLLVAILSAALALPSVAGGTTITIAATDGLWANAVPVLGTTTINNALNPREARWGVGASQSGYDFMPTATPFNAVVDGAAFLIGTFTHLNFPISAGTSITSIDLNFTLSWGGGFLPPLAGTFLFTHDETPNGADPCAYGGANGQGVNINGCADSVTVTSPFLNTIVSDGINTYFFSLLGFSSDGGITTNSQYLTVESASNTAGLYGVITSVPIGLPEVPEPATLLLVGTCIVGLGLHRRRRRQG